MKTLLPLSVVALSVAASTEALGVLFRGVEFPDGAVSFADAVVEYVNSGGVAFPYDDPSEALGPPDWVETGDPMTNFGSVSLGADPGGYLILQFVDNSLTTSGDSTPDLWIFEIGAVEGADIFISKNNLDWISVGHIAGAVSGVDLDAYIGLGVTAFEKYSYVQIVETDLPGEGDTGYPYSGTDVDAVGAISSAPPVDPVPEGGPTLGLLALGAVGLSLLRRSS